MIAYAAKYSDRLLSATLEHLEIVVITLVISLAIAALLTVVCSYSKTLSHVLLNLFSMIYSIPSLALLALLIPVTGLGKKTAVIVLVIYNQYRAVPRYLARMVLGICSCHLSLHFSDSYQIASQIISIPASDSASSASSKSFSFVRM